MLLRKRQEIQKLSWCHGVIQRAGWEDAGLRFCLCAGIWAKDKSFLISGSVLKMWNVLDLFVPLLGIILKDVECFGPFLSTSRAYSQVCGMIWPFSFRFSGLFLKMWNDLTLFFPLLGLILKDVEWFDPFLSTSRLILKDVEKMLLVLLFLVDSHKTLKSIFEFLLVHSL